MRNAILPILILLFLQACTTPEYLSEEELRDYLVDESNGVSQTKKIGKLDMTLTYRPIDFLRWQELEGEQDTATITRVMQQYDDYLYFLLQMKAADRDALYGLSADQYQFSERLQNISFRMGQFVSMTTSSSDTIPLADAHYSRMFGMSSSTDILLVFNKEKLAKTERLFVILKDFGFKTGIQRFSFKTRDLTNVPRLEELKAYYDMTTLQ